MHCGKNERLLFFSEEFAGERREQLYRVDLVTKQVDANRILLIRWVNLNAIAADAKVAALWCRFVA